MPWVCGGLTFRVGDGLLPLFDADLSTTQSLPLRTVRAAGSTPPCVRALSGCESWKQRLIDEAASILEEIKWDGGVRSFYFHDPAGTVEIADGDLSAAALGARSDPLHHRGEALSPDFPLGVELRVFIRREDAKR